MTSNEQLKKVVLIGRTNVGKSTLFNKLSEKYLAMVSAEPGTTRDLKYSTIVWQGAKFELIDSGGLTTEHLRRTTRNKLLATDEINREIVNKALAAIKQADLILFVVDARDSLTSEDRDITKWLRRRDKQVLLVANKSDGKAQRQELAEFTKLGFDEPLPTSATTGAGTGDLLDQVIEQLEIKKTDKTPRRAQGDKNADESVVDASIVRPPIKVAIIGRPNVGKSTLLNQMLGSPRSIVSPTPHTTREPIDSELEYQGHAIELIDTAGIRRKAKISLRSLERQGVRLSLKALGHADIALFVFDLSESPSGQDQKLIKEIIKAKVGVIIVANKVDLLKGQIKYNTYADIERNLRQTFNFANFAKIAIISALTKKNVPKIFELILQVNQTLHRRVEDQAVAETLKQAITKQPPPKKKTAKVRPKILELKQIDVAPPRFQLFFKSKTRLPLSYLKYLEKAIRADFEFKGVPIIIEQRKL